MTCTRVVPASFFGPWRRCSPRRWRAVYLDRGASCEVRDHGSLGFSVYAHDGHSDEGKSVRGTLLEALVRAYDVAARFGRLPPWAPHQRWARRVSR